ncbi:Spo0B C-terminal domain-containing protein [Niallia sp. Krafla_26]|uniref:Spo0B C-terminal domain-containing protein n=1 Tax=Niallia sp. Krafla_26 TaxID=3064703 RepID=UPI003D16886E
MIMKKKDWNKVELLRQVRHDWLNKLQLIKGNLDLNKIDRTKEIIAEIVIEAQNETKLSNLNFPNLTLLLLTHNWEQHSFQIEYEVLDQIKCKGIDDQWLTDWVAMFFSKINHSVKPFGNNHLSVTIEPHEQGIRFFFDFCGTIEKKDSIQEFIEVPHHGVHIHQFNIKEQEFSLEVFFQQPT